MNLCKILLFGKNLKLLFCIPLYLEHSFGGLLLFRFIQYFRNRIKSPKSPFGTLWGFFGDFLVIWIFRDLNI